MVSFVIDETQLMRLSPEARREILGLLETDLGEIRQQLGADDWDPDGPDSYPLDADEAKALIRGLTGAPREVLRVFCGHFDGETGRADLTSLLEATQIERYEQLGEEINRITHRLQGMTEQRDAWLFNWRPEDWEWDEDTKSYLKGEYFIAGPAIQSLRHAFGIAD